jgi:hypothetical protein
MVIAYRLKRRARLAREVLAEWEKWGVAPKRVPLKVLAPIFDGASLEEDEDMHERWKWLLLNASDPNAKTRVPPSFPEILKQLSPAEAKLLDALYDWTLNEVAKRKEDIREITSGRWPAMDARTFGFFVNDLNIGLPVPIIGKQSNPDTWISSRIEAGIGSGLGTPFLNLLRHQLVSQQQHLKFNENLLKADFATIPKGGIFMNDAYSLSLFGYEFVSACRKPSRS